MAFDSRNSQIKPSSEAEDISGKLASSPLDMRLLHSILRDEEDAEKDGKLIEDAINAGIGLFSPDLLFERFVKQYSETKRFTGPSFLRLLTGYDPSYVQRNMRIPEFAKKIKETIRRKAEELGKKGLISKDYSITDKGWELSGIVALLEELNFLHQKSAFGERFRKKAKGTEPGQDHRRFSAGHRFADIDMRKTIRIAAKRGHSRIGKEDIRVVRRESKSLLNVVFALDASSSMRGQKLAQCKRSALSLAFNAIRNKDNVGIVVFGADLKAVVEPTRDFGRIVRTIMRARAGSLTNIALTIRRAAELLLKSKGDKHIILITDSKPTAGERPKEDALREVRKARARGITLSIIGIELDEESAGFSESLVETGGGRLYIVRNVEELSLLVLEDYITAHS